MPHLAMNRKATIVPNGNQVASGARSSVTYYGLRPTCHPFTRHLRPARTACKAPTKLDPEQDVLGGGSGDVLQVQIGSHFKEQFGRRFSRQKKGSLSTPKARANSPEDPLESFDALTELGGRVHTPFCSCSEGLSVRPTGVKSLRSSWLTSLPVARGVHQV